MKGKEIFFSIGKKKEIFKVERYLTQQIIMKAEVKKPSLTDR